MTNNGCKRYCEVMNRPAYIVLFKGDDSDFEGNQSVDIVIDTELDTTGMKAHFRFMDFVQDFDSIPENKTLSLVFPNAKTSEFPLGAADATLRFEDASGKFRTVSNRIHIVVTNSVHEAYDNEDSQSITVTVKGTVTWEMIEGKPTFATVATSGSYNDLSDKPTIPAPVTIDPSLSPTSENPVQNKVVAKALYTGFTEWEFSGVPSGIIGYYLYWNPYEEGWIFYYYVEGQQDPQSVDAPGGEDALSTTFSVEGSTVTATRHLITPTKTSQLTNDGAPNGGGTPYATTAQIPDVTGKADKAVPSAAGNLAALTAQGNLTDSGVKPSDFATPSDLPYAMVTPGEWEFSGVPEGHTITDGPYWQDGDGWIIVLDDVVVCYSDEMSESAMSLTWYYEAFGATITATRASLSGHLLDRAGNRVVVTGDTTLTLPALEYAGRLRDFLVRLEISGSTVPTITFAAPTGETITYETDGDEFPVPDEAGDWLYSFTESCVAHKFAVSLKKVNEVAAPQAQGGS